MSYQRDFSLDNQICQLIEKAKSGNIQCSNLVECHDKDSIISVINEVSSVILKTKNPQNCVDFFKVEPSGAMRQISVEEIRNLRSSISLSPKISDKKFVVIFDAERMNNAAANAFLKVLEEPPSDTIIFLTTQRAHSVLPTIISRCCIFRINTKTDIVVDEKSKAWLSNYVAWLDDVLNNQSQENTHAIMHMYKLLSELDTLFNNLLSEQNVSKEIEPEKKRLISENLFLEIEEATGDFFRKNHELLKFYPKVIQTLEKKYQLTTFNVNFMTCIESFFIENIILFSKIPEK